MKNSNKIYRAVAPLVLSLLFSSVALAQQPMPKEEALLKQETFDPQDIRNKTLKDTTIYRADFDNHDLTDYKFANDELLSADFRDADLTNATFSDCNLAYSTFTLNPELLSVSFDHIEEENVSYFNYLTDEMTNNNYETIVFFTEDDKAIIGLNFDENGFIVAEDKPTDWNPTAYNANLWFFKADGVVHAADVLPDVVKQAYEQRLLPKGHPDYASVAEPMGEKLEHNKF